MILNDDLHFPTLILCTYVSYFRREGGGIKLFHHHPNYDCPYASRVALKYYEMKWLSCRRMSVYFFICDL